MSWLALLFAVTALLYASVGFGGGSTYNALLVLAGTDYRILPSVALICNILVVTGSTIRHSRAGTVAWSKLWPILLLSAPFAWMGGSLVISQTVFLTILTVLLFAAAILLCLQKEDIPETREITPKRLLIWPIGAVTGFVSGLAGIGGGIFLAPILYLTHWGRARQISAAASVFILVNSVAGLIGQLGKLSRDGEIASLTSYWPLAVAVIIGGQAGSHLGLKILPPKWIRIATAVLIAYVAIRLAYRLVSGTAH